MNKKELVEQLEAMLKQQEFKKTNIAKELSNINAAVYFLNSEINSLNEQIRNEAKSQEVTYKEEALQQLPRQIGKPKTLY